MQETGFEESLRIVVVSMAMGYSNTIAGVVVSDTARTPLIRQPGEYSIWAQVGIATALQVQYQQGRPCLHSIPDADDTSRQQRLGVFIFIGRIQGQTRINQIQNQQGRPPLHSHRSGVTHDNHEGNPNTILSPPPERVQNKEH
jgi:hypothetical protein